MRGGCGWRCPLWDEELVPLSAASDLAYCPRAFFLWHVWGAQRHTPAMLQGTLAALRCRPKPLADAEIIIAVPVIAPRLGIQGVLDAVERKWGMAWPIDFKWSRRPHVAPWDRIHVAAQAMALEEASGIPVPIGYVYFLPHGPRRLVRIDDALRTQVRRLIDAAEQLATAEAIPPVPDGIASRCRSCSMRPVCLPDQATALQELAADMIGGIF